MKNQFIPSCILYLVLGGTVFLEKDYGVGEIPTQFEKPQPPYEDPEEWQKFFMNVFAIKEEHEDLWKSVFSRNKKGKRDQPPRVIKPNPNFSSKGYRR